MIASVCFRTIAGPCARLSEAADSVTAASAQAPSARARRRTDEVGKASAFRAMTASCTAYRGASALPGGRDELIIAHAARSAAEIARHAKTTEMRGVGAQSGRACASQ